MQLMPNTTAMEEHIAESFNPPADAADRVYQALMKAFLRAMAHEQDVGTPAPEAMGAFVAATASIVASAATYLGKYGGVSGDDEKLKKLLEDIATTAFAPAGTATRLPMAEIADVGRG